MNVSAKAMRRWTKDQPRTRTWLLTVLPRGYAGVDSPLLRRAPGTREQAGLSRRWNRFGCPYVREVVKSAR